MSCPCPECNNDWGGACLYERIEQQAAQLAEARALVRDLAEALAHYKWRPISEIHEDYGPCVLMRIDDPGDMKIGSNLDTYFNEQDWTHFTEVPKLTTEEAAALARVPDAPKEKAE